MDSIDCYECEKKKLKDFSECLILIKEKEMKRDKIYDLFDFRK